MNAIQMRDLMPEDFESVSVMAIASKASWGYSEAEMKVFAEELTLTEALAEGWAGAKVASVEGEIVGFYTLRELAARVFELEHIFVAVGRFHCGVGSALLDEALRAVRSAGGARLRILSDPNAGGFYRRIGAQFVGDLPSSIPGRSIPEFEVRVDTGIATPHSA